MQLITIWCVVVVKCPPRYESKCFNRNIKRSDLEKEIFNRIKNLETSGEIEFTKKS